MTIVEKNTETVVGVIDPRNAQSITALLAVDDNRHVRLRPTEAGDKRRPSAYVSPGWVDLHTHVYDGTTQISVHPDRVGLDNGVHTVVDAGSAGQATLAGLLDYVVPTAETNVLAWLNIGSHGLVHLKETSDASFIDVDATIIAASSAPDVIKGIKVRSSGAIVGNMGLQPLQLGKLVARECGLPLLVHIGEAPPSTDDVLDLLDGGDTITHCYHGKTGYPWLSSGHPSPALQRAIERGVRLDVGHGAASFDSKVARAALASGYAPNTISTDIHVRNIGGPVFDLATVMTKMLHLGMPLSAIIDAVTDAPRQTLGLAEPWMDSAGDIDHATIFEVAEAAPPLRTYVDPDGTQAHPESHIVVVGSIVKGLWLSRS